MRKEEFLKQLEYLLQDIPEEDKEEAVSYYRDYLEEAGSENEEKAIEEFGSPERVAAIIRADISGNLKEGGSFTETGYVDERFKDPNYQVAKRLDLPEEKSDEGTSAGQDGAFQGTDGQGGAYQSGAYHDADGQGGTYQNGAYQSGPYKEKYTRSKVTNPGQTQERKPWTNSVLKVILWIVLIIAASPFILGAAGIVLGAVTGILSLIFGAVAVVLVLTVAAFVISVGLAAMGIVLFSFTSVFDSLFLLGIALLGIGCGLIGTVILVWIFGALLPLLWKGTVKLWNLITRRGKGEKTV